MGLATAIRGFLPNRQAQSAGGGVAGAVPLRSESLRMAPPPTPLQAPVADPRFTGAPATAVALAPNPSPAATPLTPPPTEPKKLEANILNLFMDTEAEKSPLQNLAGGLPEVDISSLYGECRHIKDILAGCG